MAYKIKIKKDKKVRVRKTNIIVLGEDGSFHHLWVTPNKTFFYFTNKRKKVALNYLQEGK